MVLPSQSGRPVSRNSHMYRRKRGRRPLVTGAILCAVALVCGWLWFSSGEPSPAAASTEREESTVADRGPLALRRVRDRSSDIASADQKQTNQEQAGSGSREPRIAMGEPVNGALLGGTTAPPTREAGDPARSGSNSKIARGVKAAPTSTSDTKSAIEHAKESSPPSSPATTPAAPPSSSTPKVPVSPPTSDALDSPALKHAPGPAGNASSTPSDTAGAPTPRASVPTHPENGRTPRGESKSPDDSVALSAVPIEEQNRARQLMQTGMNLQAENKPVEARRVLTQAYESRALAPADEIRVRQALASVNDVLVFGPSIVGDDPFASAYVVQPGDTLQKIAKPCRVEWEFLARINRMSNPRGLQVNHKLKTISGPFHAIVDKGDFRLDLYVGEASQRVFVRSFAVGLGEYNSTPVGRFKVRPRSKLKDPAWANPRTGESFEPSDPQNPIGEFWIGLEGLDEHTSELAGYGIHGTIDLDSIGQQRSMGCVRMLPDDIALVYELLMPEISTVEIRD